MFWLFLLISHALIITQLPFIFTILMTTFIGSSFLSLVVANYIIDKHWLLWQLFKACLLATVLSFIVINIIIYGLQQAELYHVQLAYKPLLAFALLSLPCAVWLATLKFYLKHSWLKLGIILLISLLNNIALILLIGHLAKWATSHGIYAAQLFS